MNNELKEKMLKEIKRQIMININSYDVDAINDALEELDIDEDNYDECEEFISTTFYQLADKVKEFLEQIKL